MHLRSRIDLLEQTFLPAKRDDGAYSDMELEQIAAFVMVVHSEFEAYFEETTSYVAKQAQQLWKHKKITSTILVSTLADLVLSEQETKILSLDDKVGKGFAKLHGYIKNNNGIKRTSVEYFLRTMGLGSISSYETLISSLDSFGSKRGDFAHGTGQKLKIILDPTEESQAVADILKELTVLDEEIAKKIVFM